MKIEINITTHKREEMMDITDLIEKKIPQGISGVCTIYAPHTTAAVTVNEGYDADVQFDILSFLNKTVPWETDYFKHSEGNSAAHIKSMLVGNSAQVIIENGKMLLGTWESIFFCDFDGPRTRKIILKFIKG